MLKKNIDISSIPNRSHSIPKYEWVSSLDSHVIMTQKEGALLGEVTDIYLDVKKNKIDAIGFKKNIMADDYFFSVKDIITIGEDIIVIKNKKSPKLIEQLDYINNRALYTIKDLWVKTMKGKKLGRLDDFDINLINYSISDICLSSGDKISVNPNEISIEKDKIIVPDEYEFKKHSYEGQELNGNHLSKRNDSSLNVYTK